jgi:GNAT superfamily N-acetyltransferase
MWAGASLPEGAVERSQFLALPQAVYRGDEFYSARPKSDVLASVHRKRFLSRQRVFLVSSGGQCIGRVVARVSPTLRDPQGVPLGMLGFFEALDRSQEVGSMLRAALSWLEEQGVHQVVGPMNGDTWHKYRFNTGPFDCPPFLGEPYNPPYYPRHWELVGFRPFESYFSTRVDDVSTVVPRFEPMLRRVLARGYRLRPIRPERFDDELRMLYDVSREVFPQNLLYEDIDWEDFRGLYSATRSIIDKDLVWFATAPDGQCAGFLFTYRDLHRAVAAMQGRRGPIAKLRFWLRRGGADAVNLKSFGVLPRFRRSGIGVALVCQVYQQMLEMGYHKANLCLIREGNPSGRMDGGQGRLLRRYVLYTTNLKDRQVFDKVE